MSVELDDSALMLRYRDGDVAAFETLYERHRGPLFRFLQRQAGDTHAAEDIFQEVWSRIIRSRTKYLPAAKFSTFMYHIGRNCLIDHYRRSGRQPSLVSIDDDPPVELTASGADPVQNAETADLRVSLQTALSDLPPDQREAFLLREEAGLSLEEISQVTGVGRETVKSRLRYAVGKLRQNLLIDEASSRTGTHNDR
jgi:RNA polymerase sigma-70 factor (ECF subfamily)